MIIFLFSISDDDDLDTSEIECSPEKPSHSRKGCINTIKTSTLYGLQYILSFGIIGYLVYAVITQQIKNDKLINEIKAAKTRGEQNVTKEILQLQRETRDFKLFLNDQMLEWEYNLNRSRQFLYIVYICRYEALTKRNEIILDPNYQTKNLTGKQQVMYLSNIRMYKSCIYYIYIYIYLGLRN